MLTISNETSVQTARMAPSGLYYPNKMVRIFLEALEDVMGTNGLSAVLNLAGLGEYRDKRPDDNLERQVDFTHIVRLELALEDMYGVRGGRGLAQRAGRALFAQGLKNFGALAGVGDLSFRVLPLSAKLKLGIHATASIFTNFSDQLSIVEEYDDHYLYSIRKCSECWGGRHSTKPCCYVATGILQEAMRWVSNGREFRIQESKCHAVGDEFCEYVIYKEPVDRSG
jgi:predicted hydrocarbon binding protein